MLATKAFGWSAQRWAVSVCLIVLPSVVAAADCGAPGLGALAGAERSQWEEFDAHGKSLVREQGTLKVVGLQVAGQCRTLDWSAHWTLSRGERDYDGVTSTQAPFQTQSRVQAQHLAVQAWLPVHAGWSMGSQLGYRHAERDIAGQGNVLGYPERFGYWQAALGARYQAALGERVHLTASAWLGGGPGGRVKLDLPSADPVTLNLGSSRMLALGVELEGGEAATQPGWSWQAGMSFRREQTNAGTSKVLVRNGIPVGAALQPHFVQRHWGGTARVTYRF